MKGPYALLIRLSVRGYRQSGSVNTDWSAGDVDNIGISYRYECGHARFRRPDRVGSGRSRNQVAHDVGQEPSWTDRR